MLGSRRSHNFGWRDMWAMIAVKGKPISSTPKESLPLLPIAESMSKAADFKSWGAPVKVIY